MPSLDDLPVELLYEVCRQVRGPQADPPVRRWDDAWLVTKQEPAPGGHPAADEEDGDWDDWEASQRGLLGLCRMNRRLYDIAHPLLYVCPAVTTPWASSCGGEGDEPPEPGSRLRQRFQQLVAVLERRPDLAATTRRVRLCAAAAADGVMLARLLAAAPGVAALRVCMGRPLTDGPLMARSTGRRRRRRSAAAASAASTGPMRSAAWVASRYRRFPTLQLDQHGHTPVLSLTPSVPCGWMLAVRVLHLRRCVRVQWAPPPITTIPAAAAAASSSSSTTIPEAALLDPADRLTRRMPQPFPTLTALHLWHTTMDIVSFRTLLGAVGPGLTTVSLRLRHMRRAEEDVLLAAGARQLQQPALRDVVEALEPWAATTLRSLAYTVDTHSASAVFSRPLPDFRSLAWLDALWLDANVFPSVDPGMDTLPDVLPPLLRIFRISGRGRPGDLYEHLHDLASAVAAKKLPRFRFFALDHQGTPGQAVLEGVLDRLRGVGVKMTIHQPVVEEVVEEEVGEGGGADFAADLDRFW